jgi:hypothetical protein
MKIRQSPFCFKPALFVGAKYDLTAIARKIRDYIRLIFRSRHCVYISSGQILA